MKALVILTIAVSAPFLIEAQESRFFIPAELQKAYDNHTRSYDGRPGPKYWQNTSDYSIKINVIPQELLIRGSEQVIYHNNSPEDIDNLVVRLYQDVFKKGNSRLIPIDARDITEGIQLSDVTINGISYDPNDPKISTRTATNIIFRLKDPLKPGSNLIFNASWQQKIPAYSTYRTGASDSSTFFIAYFYPQIAVYDDQFGWDLFDYTIRSEFYNDLANFEVDIAVPDQYIVWATGSLRNADTVYPADVYERYQKALTASDVVHIISKADVKKGFKSPHPEWHFTAKEVSDFAFAMGSNQLWDATSISADNRKVLINSVVSGDFADNIPEHLSYQRNGMLQFSEDIPGIAYPYNAFTTFVTPGGSGMEYPMMAWNGGTDRRTTLHEMFHTYFPMYVRINERRWAWMDEGLTNYNTFLAGNRFFNKDKDLTHVFNSTIGFLGTSGDVPMITPSQYLIDPVYRWVSYQASETLFAILHHYLGDEIFIKCFREFIKRWAKKSPTPYDFFYTMENVSGKDLSWLWKPWVFEFGTADLSIGSLNKGKLVIANKGSKPVPVLVEIHYQNGQVHKMSESAFIWSDGRKETKFNLPGGDDIKWISVNSQVMDLKPTDNFFPSIHALYENIKEMPDITGNYVMDVYSVSVQVSKVDGLLYFRIPRMNISMIIYPVDSEHYVSLDGSVRVAFRKNEKNVVSHMDIEWNGSFHAGKTF